MRERWRRVLLEGLPAGVLTALSAHWICNLIFQCGCTWALAGATAHCNIHSPAPPHCPTCADMLLGALFSFAVFTAWWAAVALARRVVRRVA